ncbi:hypothetical protein CROQUDRAFT_669818 [Cronartium quercuum f. sp. fusiforme G11]|uniref:Uncharacterized protein n=1 Tax=Cronartium quercuum f. sp. fusiforme G11 TaxID=708437 RepID=A0A9P6TEC4_9BASI|nr:hypothetical protein CROQUDRAFT_669818 [Cronartium quercuum f. sp. fusiforme G11]
MSFSDDESDLSDSLSSACSTLPLPPSELGSRVGSPNPPSPSAPGISTTSTTAKPEQTRKSRTGKSKHLATSTFPDNFEKDNLKKSRIISRSHASAGPSTPVDIDRCVKAESLPPPSSIQRRRRSSLSSNTPRATSAKGNIFDPNSIILPVDPLTNSSGSAQHPCTSHGRLPLFEQPVLLQGARPRRVAITASQKAVKPPKPTRTKINGSSSKHRNSISESARSSNLHSDFASQRAQAYKDDESSLTEQSSSDEEDHAKPRTGEATCVPSKRSSSPFLQPVRQNADQQLDLSQSNSYSVPLCAPALESSQPTVSGPTHKLRIILPSPLVAPNCANLAPPSQDDLSKMEVEPTSTTPSPNLDQSTPVDSLSVLHDTSNIPVAAPTRSSPEPCNTKSKAGRGVSEESALTPEPDDDHQDDSSHLVAAVELTLPHHQDPIPPHTTSVSSSPKAVRRSLPVCSPVLESTSLPNHSEQCQSLPRPSQSSSLPFHPPSGIRPHSLSIIPAPFTDPNIELALPVVADQGTDTEPTSSTAGPSRNYQGWETGSAVPTPCLLGSSLVQPVQPNTAEYMTDDALDGEPIAEDAMDYEMRVEESSKPVPSVANALGYVISDEAMDGVPLAQDEDQRSAVEVIPVEPKLDVKLEPPSTEDQSDTLSPGLPEPKPEPVPLKPPPAPADTVYEHDDHVRRREEALQAMVKIEIRFAQLRDRLYIERMADVHRETSAIQQGSHPELNEYYDMLERKRNARLSLATKVFSLKEVELSKRREAATNAVWNKWSEAKTELRNRMISETQSQMKQVEREKLQPELRYNVEVQLLPKPIIPQAPRRRSRKRAKFDYADGREETLAVELRAAVAKRTSLNLSSLTAEESWMDLANMKTQPAFTPYPDPLSLSRPAPHATTPNGIFASPSLHSLPSTNGPDRLEPTSSSSGPIPMSNGKTIPMSTESLLMRYRQPNHVSSHTISIDSLRPNSRPTSIIQNGFKHDTGLDSSRSILETGLSLGTTSGNEKRGTNLINSKLTDRRPTLDSVMAHNNTSCNSNINIGNGSTTNNTFNRHHISSNVSSSHSNTIYPTLPITVNYH